MIIRVLNESKVKKVNYQPLNVVLEIEVPEEDRNESLFPTPETIDTDVLTEHLIELFNDELAVDYRQDVVKYIFATVANNCSAKKRDY